MSASGNSPKKLFIGIGNSARGDDAIGWLLADFVKENFSSKWQVEYRYQLQVEDADLISQFDEVIFADASEEQFSDGFSFQPCQPSETYFYSSHLQSPEAVLYLCREIYKKSPVAFVLSVSGYEWELGDKLSLISEEGMKRAIDWIMRELG